MGRLGRREISVPSALRSATTNTREVSVAALTILDKGQLRRTSLASGATLTARASSRSTFPSKSMSRTRRVAGVASVQSDTTYTLTEPSSTWGETRMGAQKRRCQHSGGPYAWKQGTR